MAHELTLLPRARPVERARLGAWLAHAPLALVLGLQTSIAPELSFLLLSALLAVRVLRRGLRLPVVPTVLWLPFLVAAAAGSLSALAWDTRDVVRDLWLIGAPAALVVLGWELARDPGELRGHLRAIVLGAFLSSLLHLARAVEHAELLAVSRDVFRQSAGGGSVLPTLALFLLLAPSRLGTEPLFRSRLFVALVLCTCLAAQFVSFSRTWWLATATYAGLFGAVRWGPLVAGFTLALAGALALGLDTVALEGRFLERVEAFGAEALAESLTPRNFATQRDLNAYWRSYESYRGLEALEREGPLALVVGQGLGMRLDLGMYQLLDGEYRRLVPVLHNGFLYLVLKCGVVGLVGHLAWMLASFVRAWRATRDGRGELRLAGLLALGAVLVLLESTFFVGGAFNFRPAFPTLLLLGLVLRRAQQAHEVRA